jgi:hypothetical protein
VAEIEGRAATVRINRTARFVRSAHLLDDVGLGRSGSWIASL